MSVISGNLADGKPMAVGGWYNGQQWDGSKLSAVGTESNGNKVSNEVIAQTNPSNVAYIENLRASQLQPATNLNLPSVNAEDQCLQMLWLLLRDLNCRFSFAHNHPRLNEHISRQLNL
jgi:hypothetical protein